MLTDASEYLYLDFGSGIYRRECLYPYGRDAVNLEWLRLEFMDVKPETIRVPDHLKDHQELHDLLAQKCPGIPVYYFYTGEV